MCCLLVVLRLLVLLRQCMVVPRQVGHGKLQVIQHLLVVRWRVMLPVLALQVVLINQRLLALQDQYREAALLVSLDNTHLEAGCEAMDGVLFHKGLECLRGVIITLLLQVQLAKVVIDNVFVVARATVVEIVSHTVGALRVGKAQTDNTQGVIHQFTPGTAQVLELCSARLGVLQFQIEQCHKGIQ